MDNLHLEETIALIFGMAYIGTVVPALYELHYLVTDSHTLVIIVVTRNKGE
jgi:hypothetical protein